MRNCNYRKRSWLRAGVQGLCCPLDPLSTISETVQEASDSFDRHLSAGTQSSGGQGTATSEPPEITNILRTTLLIRKQF